MSHRSSRFAQPFMHGMACLASALAVACQPFGTGAPVPASVQPEGVGVAPSLVIDAAAVEEAKARLSGRVVSDFTRTLVSAPSRWQEPAAEPSGADRRVQALGGAVDPDWPAAGIDLRAAPFNLTPPDRATNGAALRAFGVLSKRLFLISQAGKFISLDPDNPLVGYAITNLPGNFTKTYVTLSGDGATAFVVNDAGTVFAINVATTLPTSPPSSSYKSLALSATCRGGALFADPTASSVSSGATTLYVVDNDGSAHKLRFSGNARTEANFAAATLTETAAPVSLTTATPFGGGDRVKAPPVVLKGVLVVGDRAGNVIRYDYNTGVKTTTVVNYGWPIETPVAVDIDGAFNMTDIFAAAGAQLFWVKPSGAVYTGQYALVEKGGNEDIVHAGNFGSYVNITTPTPLTANTDFTAFSAATSSLTDALDLPLSPNTPNLFLDYNRLTHCGFLTGLPPEIWPHAGKTGTKFYNYYPWNTTSNPVALSTGMTPPGSGTTLTSYPVQDGEALAGASLLSPSAIEFDDDGSSFVADTNHCQVLFNPASASAWSRWYPSGAMTNASFSWRAGARPDGPTTVTYTGTPASSPPESNFYVFAGTLFPHAPSNDVAPATPTWSGRHGGGFVRDVGNGAGGDVYTQPVQGGAGVIARGTAVNRVQGLAVGNLGLYVANRNAFQSQTYKDGQILFMPRANLTGTYWGITNPQAGRMYVICNFVDPQGLSCYRDPNGTRDVVFAPSMNSASPNRNKIFKLDSTTVGPATTAATAGVQLATPGVTLSDPYDTGLDDNGNLFIANHGADQLLMIAKVVPKNPSAPTRNWGTAGAAGQGYVIKTGMQEIASVTFAANDPQLPSGQGCLYIACGAVPSSSPNRIVRLDETLYHQSVAGPSYGSRNTGFTTTENLALADSTDSTVATPVNGDAATTRLAMPWRARGRFNTTNNTFETYICDRGNNRIRKIISSSGSSSANGYLCFPVPAAAQGKPIYSATLSLVSRAASGTLTAPEVGFAAERLKNGTVWSNATVAASPASFKPTLAPAVDLTLGRAQPILPNTTGIWSFLAGSTYKWRLQAQMIFTSSTNTAFQHLRLGVVSPVDTNFYFYPTSTGTISLPNVKSPDFYTNRNGALAAQYPKVDYVYGNRAIGPILSPPAIYYKDGNLSGTRYVYLTNANAVWRYNVTNPQDFITSANGAEVAFSKTAQGRDAAKGTVYTPGSVFQFNSTPPLVSASGKVYAIDIYGASAGSYSYFLNQFDGNLAPTSAAMYQAGQAIATGVASSTSDNAGIYITGNPEITQGYFGLANGRIYRLSLQ